MRIFIEGSPLFRQRTGVGQYTKNLIESLLKLDKKNNYTIFGFWFFGKKLDEKPIPEGPNLEYRLIRYLPSKVFNVLIRKFIAPPIDLMLFSKPDLFFFPNFVRYPLAFNGKSLIVIYDLSFRLHGQYSPKRNRDYLNRYVPQSARIADHIITISENSKEEIVENYQIDSEKITIVHPSIDHEFFFERPSGEIAIVKNKYGIKSSYILYTGTLEPRKNINGIIDAYALLDPKLKNEYSLVLAGGKGWLDESIKQRLNETAELDIITTGYVPDEDLPALYSGASVFVYPSFYEGFGMPPLEAMACACPVICADNSSLPEVVGDAGILINAEDTQSLTDSIEKVLTDGGLASAMSKKGLSRASTFSWESSAQKLLDVIERMKDK